VDLNASVRKLRTVLILLKNPRDIVLDSKHKSERLRVTSAAPQE